MKKKIQKWLLDIHKSILNIESFMEGTSDFEQYSSKLMLRRAVERELEILGEAVNRILQKDPEFPISDSRKIVNLRNHIIHQYDDVSNEIIWGILVNNLPTLKEEVNTLINSKE
jgi:uncharacterized protein with HEPN domain